MESGKEKHHCSVPTNRKKHIFADPSVSVDDLVCRILLDLSMVNDVWGVFKMMSSQIRC